MSTDDGATWSTAQPLNTTAVTDAGADQEPQVSTDDIGNWIIAWMSGDTLGGTIGVDADILFAGSTDGGANWSAPQPLNTNAAGDSGSDDQVALPLTGDIAVQVHNSDSLLCGSSVFSTEDVLVNDGDKGLFKAKTK